MRNLIYKVICTLRRHASTHDLWNYFDELKAAMELASISEEVNKEMEEYKAA